MNNKDDILKMFYRFLKIKGYYNVFVGKVLNSYKISMTNWCELFSPSQYFEVLYQIDPTTFPLDDLAEWLMINYQKKIITIGDLQIYKGTYNLQNLLMHI